MHEGPQLFDVHGAPSVPAIAVRREGAIEVRWEIDLGIPTASWRSDVVEVHCWQTEELNIELAVGEHRPELPPDLAITRCWLGAFRIQAAEPHGRVRRRGPVALPRLCCLFRGGEDSWIGGGDSGEGLDAQTWEAGETRLSIGTEDADFLCHRVRDGKTLPTSWERQLCSFFEQPGSKNREQYPVHYLEDGLALQLPRLPRGGYCEVHFASAIGQARAEDDVSTWYAVDLDPRSTGPTWAR